LRPSSSPVHRADPRALSWPALLSWALLWLVLLPFAQATAGETAPAFDPGAPAGLAIHADDGEDAHPRWQAPAQAEPAAIEPLPDRESDPSAGAMPAPRHGMPFRRHAAVDRDDIHFRPDNCLPPHGHAPPHA
jgi:hypothetical protein